MANPLSKGWKYLMSSFDHKIDSNADPKVQIHQAAEAAKQRHQEITEQASEIIGNKSRLEMQMNRLTEQAKQYQSQTEQALRSSAEASAAGDTQTAQQYDQAAEVVASQLVAAETQLEDLKVQYQAAVQAAEQATAQQQQSEARLREDLSQVDQLLAQADQAKMQEQATQSLGTIDDLSPDSAVPTLDGIRAKVEKRYADALGAQELSQTQDMEAIAEFSQTSTDMKAASKLEEIRAQLNEKKSLEAKQDESE